jgi:hypothetical protein
VKEDELIRAIVSDLKPVPVEFRFGRALAQFLLWSALSMLVFTRGGTAISDGPGLLPLSVLVILLGTAAAGALVSSIPGRSSWRVALVVAAVLVGVCAGDGVIRTTSVWPASEAVWGEVPWTKCFAFTLVFAVIPTLALIRIVNRGWPVHPRATAVLTFVAGTAAGALTIALECPSHAPLHVLVGHTLPIGAAAAIGVSLALRLFRLPVGQSST